MGTLRLPSAYTALFVLVDAALLVSLLDTVQTSVNLTKTAGWIVMAFAVIGRTCSLGSLSVATGGRPFPLGRPLLR